MRQCMDRIGSCEHLPFKCMCDLGSCVELYNLLPVQLLTLNVSVCTFSPSEPSCGEAEGTCL